jgi:hypothetical protein
MQTVDAGLAQAFRNVTTALDTLPHGEARKITATIDALYSEAVWLNVQRDTAREELAAAQIAD